MTHWLWTISYGPYDTVYLEKNFKKYGWNFYRFFVLLFERMERGSSNEGTSQTKIRDYRMDHNSNRKRKSDEITPTV